MTGSDIGIGIIDVSWAPGMTANITIAAEFGYDPATNGNKGSGPSGGSTLARATLADVLSPREVVRVEKIPLKALSQAAAELRLTVKLAARGQYLTPGTFSGTVTLAVP